MLRTRRRDAVRRVAGTGWRFRQPSHLRTGMPGSFRSGRNRRSCRNRGCPLLPHQVFPRTSRPNSNRKSRSGYRRLPWRMMTSTNSAAIWPDSVFRERSAFECEAVWFDQMPTRLFRQQVLHPVPGQRYFYRDLMQLSFQIPNSDFDPDVSYSMRRSGFGMVADSGENRVVATAIRTSGNRELKARELPELGWCCHCRHSLPQLHRVRL